MKALNKLWGEFKKFITRGNVIDLAVGVVVGAAFTAIVTSLTNDMIMPLINWAVGGDEGGRIVAAGSPDAVKNTSQSVTGQYL